MRVYRHLMMLEMCWKKPSTTMRSVPPTSEVVEDTSACARTATAVMPKPAIKSTSLATCLAISSLTEPFYGGKTHLHPEHAGTWFDPTMLASGTGGWYRSIAPTPEEAEAFAAAWAEGDPRLAPTAEDWLRYEAARASAPPRAAAARPRFRDPAEE